MDNVVWVLGAGFSRPLGGPLLPELMRPEVRSLLAACYPEPHYRNHEPFVELVLYLYAYGRRFQEGRELAVQGEPGEHLWQDAEQFLDYLDTAAADENAPARRQIERIVRAAGSYWRLWPMENGGAAGFLILSRTAKRIVAGVCSAFLRGADPSTERWEPYLTWARSLMPGDTVITFNYDAVPDLLATQTKTLEVASLGGVRNSAAARVLKLHGSVNWRVKGWPADEMRLPTGNEAVEIAIEKDFDFSLTCAPHELAIASPGPVKRAVSGWLKPLWDEAAEALRYASAIVFVGYRFPESDSYARRRLLDAIGSNTRKYLPVHVVLGPQPGDAQRLRSLLDFKLAHRKEVANDGTALKVTQHPFETDKVRNLLVHPLYAQDFLSVVHRGHITEAWQVLPRSG